MYEGKKEQLNSTSNRPYIVQVCDEGGAWLSGYFAENLSQVQILSQACK